MHRSHRLHFSVKLRGNRPDKFFAASGIPAGSPLFDVRLSTDFFSQSPDSRFQEGDLYTSPWAEVGYYLKHVGQAGTTPLFALFRSQRVVVPNNRDLNWPKTVVTPPPPPVIPVPFSAPNLIAHQEISWAPFPLFQFFPPYQSLYFTNPSDLAGSETIRPIRASLQRYPDSVLNPPPGGILSERGESLLLTDVISFNVRVLKLRPGTGQVEPDFTDLDWWTIVDNPQTRPHVRANPRIFDTNPYHQMAMLDQPSPAQFSTTATNNAVPIIKGYVIKAIQITIRVWDEKTKQARQVTIIQDM